MSYTNLIYHIVLGTHKRERVIFVSHERELYSFMYKFLMERGIKIYRIGGMPDHVHILCEIPSKYSVSEIVRILKSETSKFMSANSHFNCWSKWGEGYGAFTVSMGDIDRVRQYIANQKVHHTHDSFEAEFRQLLIENGLALDELPFVR
ncbi:MAG: IS200/IS605 family transposase [Muribaculaceae bacterium]|nr:IS200/IS605 family transposase [Muribaculaceae bacterium]